MKVGIVTLNGYWNYGNRLQNFALKQILSKKFNHEVVTIKTWQSEETKGGITGGVDFLRKLKNRRIKESFELTKRINNFKEFSKTSLAESNFQVDLRDSENKLNSFDRVIIGSDQVWNTTWLNESKTKFFLLSSVEPKKRVAYAASLGVDFVVEEFKDLFINELNKFRSVSVREQSAQYVLGTMTGRSYPVVLDPTMLLTKGDWEAEINHVDSFGENFVFEYFLGKKTPDVRRKISEVETHFNGVVAFNDFTKIGREYYSQGPLEFVKAISESSVVVTDSFHAAVFALLFNKPLYIVERVDRNSKMSSRMDTLFKNVGADKKTINDFDYNTCQMDAYDLVGSQLNELRKKSMEFLENALKGNE